MHGCFGRRFSFFYRFLRRHVDAAFELRTVFQRDAGRDNVAFYFACFGNHNHLRALNITIDHAMNFDCFGIEVSVDRAGVADCEVMVVQMNLTVDLTVDLQVFLAGNFTFNFDRCTNHCCFP